MFNKVRLIAPCILAAFLIAIACQPDADHAAATMPSSRSTVRIIAKRFEWQFQYPDGTISNELHLPSNSPVEFIITSLDVIHGPFIEPFGSGVKLPDARPQHESTASMKSTGPPLKTKMICTQYCGKGHVGMVADVVIQSPDEFDQWLRSAATTTKPANE